MMTYIAAVVLATLTLPNTWRLMASVVSWYCWNSLGTVVLGGRLVSQFIDFFWYASAGGWSHDVPSSFDRLTFLQVRWVLLFPLDCKRKSFCNIPCVVRLVFRWRKVTIISSVVLSRNVTKIFVSFCLTPSSDFVYAYSSSTFLSSSSFMLECHLCSLNFAFHKIFIIVGVVP